MKNLIAAILVLVSIGSYAQTKEWVKKNTEGTVIEKGTYENKKQHGVWNYYYNNGIPSLTANYVNGVLNGQSIRYDLQGHKIAVLNYENGEITGLQQYYYPGGILLSEGNMINGKEDGAWKYYNQQGAFIGYIKYKNGVQINEQTK
jgi:antitoxin component YwqK of YwqJK toxin-antitoxin module